MISLDLGILTLFHIDIRFSQALEQRNDVTSIDSVIEVIQSFSRQPKLYTINMTSIEAPDDYEP